MLRDQLDCAGVKVGRRRVGILMKRMGIEVLYRKPGTSKKHPGHKVYPYLLRGMTINRSNQVWAMDTTYIPMAKRFVYLTAVVDWASRKVLAAKIAITQEACHAVDVLREAFTHHGTPEIVNTDKGSQFTAKAFVQAIMRYMDRHNRFRPHSRIEKKHPTRRTLRCCRRSKGQLNYGQRFHLKIKKNFVRTSETTSPRLSGVTQYLGVTATSFGNHRILQLLGII